VIGFTPPNTLTVNGAKFVPPSAPVLLQILSGTKSATDLLPPGSVYVLPRNSVIEVSIPGGTPGAPVSENLEIPNVVDQSALC
jgi:iron transport multicopper oxidase